MTDTRISVTAPLAPAWERTKNLLFKPFDLGRWMVVGFSAWLAGLAGGGGGGVNFNLPMGGWGDGAGASAWPQGIEGVGDAAREAWGNALAGGCLALLVLGCLLGIALGLVVLWVASRGKFVFLDNVVHGRAAIVEPWKRLRRQGNSHFAFQLLFVLAALLAMGLAVGGIVLAAGGLAAFDGAESLGALAAIPAVFALVVLIFFFVLVILLVAYFLDAFVVPLMHRYDLGVTEGWRRFLALFRERPWPYLLSGVLLLGLGLGLGFAVVAAGLMTCCIGFLVLMIPYIGTVVILPAPVFYRAYTFELLAQADPGLLSGDGGEVPEAAG